MNVTLQTTNQIEVAVAQQKVADLYTCMDLLPSWSPGLLSFEVLSDGAADEGTTFKQRYLAMGREIEEVLTVMENELPNALCVLAEDGGTLTRESRITFEPLGEDATRVTVQNTFSGEVVVHLVKRDLHHYTQGFLEAFKAFAERTAP